MKIIKFLLLLFSCQIIFSQDNSITPIIFAALDQSDYNAAKIIIDNLNDSDLKTSLNIHYELIKNGNWNDNHSKIKDTLSLAYNIYLINKGVAFFTKEGKDFDSYKTLNKSLTLAKWRQDKVLICQSLKFMLEIYLRYHIDIKDDKYLYLIETFRKHAINELQEEIINYFEFHIFLRSNYKRYESYQKIDSLYDIYIHKRTTNPFYKVRRSEVLNTYHRNISNNIDSAYFHINEASKGIKILQKGVFEREREKAILINTANTFIELKKYQLALEVLELITITERNKKRQYESFPEHLLIKYLNFSKSETYFGLKDSLNGYKFKSKGLNYEQRDELHKSQSKVTEIEEKYQSAEKEKKLIESELISNNRKNINIWLVALLLFVVIIALLTRTALKRKQKLAEKEKELEIQKNEELLRKHEIQTVNAMIIGQEKERKRIANDLHDNINSDIITAKVQLEHLSENIKKVDNPQKILDLCVDILDDAYHKTRNISHERNSGVMAQKELIPGIKKLAEKASTAYGLLIDVHDYGFESKLSNSVEITIFSIIQELVTNILKHAKATEASISLTQHDEEVNIIIEDNGIGFDSKKERSTKGMGLGNIQEQLEQINGTLAIDSTSGKGTTVVIDIKNDIM